ncbi:MAG: SDR family oxidoreductase, partial [Gammaproteobacteria bacterium]|nr:SDR family oxidoreductase [Gammaproteobacteria bacterium]
MAKSKVAVVTGAGSGIGREVAITFLKSGYAVALAGRRIPEMEETVSLAGGGQSLIVSTDVSQPAAVDALFAETKSAFGRLDVLFNNAGISGPKGPFEDITFEDWNAVVGINLTGTFLCAQAAWKMMKAQDPQGGRIINNGSVSAQTPRPSSAPYTTTKHAVTGLTKTLALDGRPFNIACGQIDIGNAATEMTERMKDGVPQADGSIRAEPRMDVAHVASSVLYMASLPLDANVQFLTVMATKMPF